MLIWVILMNFEIGPAVDRLDNLNWSYLVGIAGVYFVLWINNTERWRYVLTAINAPLSFGRVGRILYISYFFSLVLLSAVGGDAFRMYLARKAGLTLQSAVNSVMLERIATVSGLIILVLAMQPFLMTRIGDNAAIYAFPILAVIIFIAVIVLLTFNRLPLKFQNIKIVRALSKLLADAKKIFLPPKYAIRTIGMGITGNILIAFMAYLMARSLNIEVSLLNCLVLIPPVISVRTLPISISGWGVREGAMIIVFSFVGMAEGDAFVMSVLFGLINTAFALPGGLIWLWDGRDK